MADVWKEILVPLKARMDLLEANDDEAALYLYATLAGQALNGHPDQALQAYANLEKQRDASTFLRYITKKDLQALRTSAGEISRQARMALGARGRIVKICHGVADFLDDLLPPITSNFQMTLSDDIDSLFNTSPIKSILLF